MTGLTLPLSAAVMVKMRRSKMMTTGSIMFLNANG